MEKDEKTIELQKGLIIHLEQFVDYLLKNRREDLLNTKKKKRHYFWYRYCKELNENVKIEQFNEGTAFIKYDIERNQLGNI